MRKFEPAPDYVGLLRQTNAILMRLKGQEKLCEHYHNKCKNIESELAMIGFKAIQAERETNEQLTNALEIAEREIDRLRALVESNKQEIIIK